MRAFILLCLVAVACAQYNYGAGQSGGSPGSSSGNVQSFGSGGLSSLPGGEFTKEFYTFIAPEDKIDPAAIQRLVNQVKKNIRVIFIKNPENKAYEDAVVNLAAQASQQKTAIYVLNKQHDLNDLASKFNAIRSNVNAKPDVHFVKYRTPEDAVNAQKAIQSQYDALGGPSQHINGGIAPALNFASQSPTADVPVVPSGGAAAPQSVYLPSSILSRLRAIRRV